MIAYKKIVTVKDPERIVLSGVPFRRGQRVEVLMIAEDKPAARIKELNRLLRQTQKPPAARRISEEEIAEEIAQYRAGR